MAKIDYNNEFGSAAGTVTGIVVRDAIDDGQLIRKNTLLHNDTIEGNVPYLAISRININGDNLTLYYEWNSNVELGWLKWKLNNTTYTDSFVD